VPKIYAIVLKETVNRSQMAEFLDRIVAFERPFVIGISRSIAIHSTRCG
jgi:hypothetical protein